MPQQVAQNLALLAWQSMCNPLKLLHDSSSRVLGLARCFGDPALRPKLCSSYAEQVSSAWQASHVAGCSASCPGQAGSPRGCAYQKPAHIPVQSCLCRHRGSVRQPATSQVQATLLPSGCPCPNRALAAQQARHHIHHLAGVKLRALEGGCCRALPRALLGTAICVPCHWCCCAAGSGQPAGQPRAPCGPRVSPAQPHTGLYQSPALSAKRTGVTVRRAACV